MATNNAALRATSGRQEICCESSAEDPDASIKLKMDFPSQMAVVSKDPLIRDQFSPRPFDLIQRDSTNNNTDVVVPFQIQPPRKFSKWGNSVDTPSETKDVAHLKGRRVIPPGKW